MLENESVSILEELGWQRELRYSPNYPIGHFQGEIARAVSRELRESGLRDSQVSPEFAHEVANLIYTYAQRVQNDQWFMVGEAVKFVVNRIRRRTNQQKRAKPH